MSTSLTRVLRDQLCVAAPAAPQRSLNAAASGRSALAAALRRPSDTVAAARRSAATTRWLRRPAAASGEPSSSPSALQQAALRLAAGLAAAVLIAQPASAAASGPPVVLNAAQTAAEEQGTEYMYQGKLLFDPMAYSGRWYEVASLKKGFAGEGQADCHVRVGTTGTALGCTDRGRCCQPAPSGNHPRPRPLAPLARPPPRSARRASTCRRRAAPASSCRSTLFACTAGPAAG